jgi:hypothetical protein
MRGEVTDEYEDIVAGLAGENEETRRKKLTPHILHPL